MTRLTMIFEGIMFNLEKKVERFITKHIEKIVIVKKLTEIIFLITLILLLIKNASKIYEISYPIIDRVKDLLETLI